MYQKILATMAVLLALAGTADAQESECLTYTYQVSPGYDFKGIIKFDYLDLDIQKVGIQNSVTSYPGQRMTAQVKWTFGSSCPACTFYINVFGSWDDGREVAKLYSGTIGGAPSSSVVPISFEVPGEGGEYTLRVIYALGEGYAEDFQARNLVKAPCTEDRHVFFFDGLVMVAPGDREPFKVRITAPSSPTGISEKILGGDILINGTVSGNVSRVALYIDGKNIAGALPFLWSTANESQGLHSIVLEAVDFANNSARDEFRVELINSSAYGKQPRSLWVNVLDKKPSDMGLSWDGRWIAVGGDGYLPLYNSNGLRVWKKSTAGAPKVAISGDGGTVAAAVGKDLRYFSRDGAILWNYTLGGNVGDVVLTTEGYLAASSGKELYLLDSTGALLWNISLDDLITGTASYRGGSLVVAAKNRVYAISNESAVVWTYTTPNPIGAVSASAKDGAVVSSGRDIFYLSGNGTLTRSFLAAAPISSLSLSADGRYLAAASGRTVFFFKDASVQWSRQAKESVTSVLLSSDAAYTIYSHGSTISFHQNPLPEKKEGPSLEDRKILLGLAVAVLALGAFLYLRNRRGMKTAEVKEVPKSREAQPGLDLEAVSEGLGLFKHAVVRVEVKNAKTDKPVIKAQVTLGSRTAETNEGGMAVFEDVPRGEYELRVEREFYGKFRDRVRLQEQEVRLVMRLSPVSGLDETRRQRLKEALGGVRSSYLSVPAADPCLPTYYKSMGEQTIDFVEKLSDIPTFFEKFNYEEVVDELILNAEFICKELAEILVDWKNVKIYERGVGEGTGCEAKEFRGIKEFEKAMEDPGEFVEERLQQVRRRMHDLDEEITGRIKDITIMPISGVWRISEGLMGGTREEAGERLNSQLKIAILILFADAVLDYVEDMLGSEDILERLKVSIL